MRMQPLLKWVGTATALAGTAAVLDWHAFINGILHLSLGVLSVAAALSLATTAMLSLRWAVLAAPPTKAWGSREFKDALAGLVFNLFTPASVGADAYRLVIAGDREGGRTRAAGLLLLERMLGIAGYAVVFLIGYAAAIAESPVAPVFVAAAISFAAGLSMLVVAILLMRLFRWDEVSPWIHAGRSWVRDAAFAVSDLPSWRFAIGIVLSFMAALTWLGYFLVLAYGTKLTLTAPALTMAAIVTEFSRLLPISIQGIGVREATFAWLATEAGGAAGPALATCAVAYALHFALVGVAGVTARTSFGFRRLGRVG